MSDSKSAEDMVIRIAALKAAKDAADHIVKTKSSRPPNSVGAFALYTWGSLALVSAAYAAVLGLNLEDLTFQADQLAVIEAPVEKHTVLTVGASSDFENDQLAKTDKETPPVPVELSDLPAPLVPKIELPKDHLAAAEKSFTFDELNTGSVNAHVEDSLQPFPDDVLPENLFAVDIGGAKAIAPLVGRYSALKRRAPDLFSDLEPRIQLKGADSSLEARLVAGPFTSQNQVAQFCRSLRLRLTVDCKMSSFEGDTIQ